MDATNRRHFDEEGGANDSSVLTSTAPFCLNPRQFSLTAMVPGERSLGWPSSWKIMALSVRDRASSPDEGYDYYGSSVHCGAVPCNAVWCIAVQSRKMGQFSTVKCCLVQCNGMQCCAV